MTLFERIKKEIEREANKKGIYFPSAEEVTISIQLTDEELRAFFDTTCNELVESEHYEYDLQDNKLTVSYRYEE